MSKLRDLPGSGTARPSQRSADEPLFEEFTRLNNELADAQRALAKQNAALVALNEEKNRLLGMAAHDLRNPLGVIMSYAKFLDRMAGAKLDAKELQFVAQIEKSSQFMLRLLEDLLDVSQIESGRLNLAKAPTDLAALVRNNIELNRVLAGAKDIAIELDLPEALPPLEADATKIEQVLNNLVSNALKYSHAGTTVRVTVDADAQSVTVAVRILSRATCSFIPGRGSMNSPSRVPCTTCSRRRTPRERVCSRSCGA